MGAVMVGGRSRRPTLNENANRGYRRLHDELGRERRRCSNPAVDLKHADWLSPSAMELPIAMLDTVQ